MGRQIKYRVQRSGRWRVRQFSANANRRRNHHGNGQSVREGDAGQAAKFFEAAQIRDRADADKNQRERSDKFSDALFEQFPAHGFGGAFGGVVAGGVGFFVDGAEAGGVV